MAEQTRTRVIAREVQNKAATVVSTAQQTSALPGLAFMSLAGLLVGYLATREDSAPEQEGPTYRSYPIEGMRSADYRGKCQWHEHKMIMPNGETFCIKMDRCPVGRDAYLIYQFTIYSSMLKEPIGFTIRQEEDSDLQAMKVRAWLKSDTASIMSFTDYNYEDVFDSLNHLMHTQCKEEWDAKDESEERYELTHAASNFFLRMMYSCMSDQHRAYLPFTGEYHDDYTDYVQPTAEFNPS